MNDILEQIALHKRIEVEDLKGRWPLETLAERSSLLDRLSFRDALTSPAKVKIIAEIKKASPSKGVLIDNFDPEELAARYRIGGAAAISVLTEQNYFMGKIEYLQIAKQSARLPILCKDFIIDPYQIHLAAAKGADAVLLIAKLLTPGQLADFIQTAAQCGLDSVIEVHSEGELENALNSGAEIIGVNARDLSDFSVTLDTTVQLGKLIPAGKLKVAESGICNVEDIRRLSESGFSCFLVGEALVKSRDPVALLRKLQEA
jgi:indole-3-glycerol phosphate synthase